MDYALALPSPSLRTETIVVVISVDGGKPEVESTQEELISHPEEMRVGETDKNVENPCGREERS